MIRSRDMHSRQHRRRMRRAAPRDHRDEPLRVLARQTARDLFEREAGAQIKLVAGARNRRYLQLWTGAA